MTTVCVLGMHRSGTSCLAGSLQAAGISGGRVIEYATDNPKGNRENQAIMSLNDQVLACNNGTWDHPPKRLEYFPEHQQQRDKLIEELDSQFSVWMFKDPRTVLTLSFWQEGISNLQLIGTFRHPLKVAMSLYKRQGISLPLREGIGLWIHYNRLIVKAFNRTPFPLICFDLPQQKYLARLTEIVQDLNHKLPDDFELSISKVTEFYESTLVHQNNTALFYPTKEDELLLAEAEFLYQELREKSGLEVNREETLDRILIVPLERDSAAYLKAIEIQPNNPQLYYMLAKAQQEEGDLNKAIASSQAALKLDNNNIDTLEQLSELLVQNECAEQALKLVISMIKRQPNNPRIYLILADLQRQQQDLESAIITYQKVIKLIPADVKSYIYLGKLLVQCNRIEEAISNCQQALQLHPQNSQIYSILGKAYAVQKDFKTAISCYQQAIDLDNNNAEVYFALGQSLKEQGNLKKAIALYQKALEFNHPDS